MDTNGGRSGFGGCGGRDVGGALARDLFGCVCGGWQFGGLCFLHLLVASRGANAAPLSRQDAGSVGRLRSIA